MGVHHVLFGSFALVGFLHSIAQCFMQIQLLLQLWRCYPSFCLLRFSLFAFFCTRCNCFVFSWLSCSLCFKGFWVLGFEVCCFLDAIVNTLQFFCIFCFLF